MPLLSASFLPVYVPKYTQYASGDSSAAGERVAAATANRAAAAAARTNGRAIGKSSVGSEIAVPRTGERVDDNDRNPRRVLNSPAEESSMRAVIAGVVLAACAV